MTDYINIISDDTLAGVHKLKERKVEDFKKSVSNLRVVMGIIGKPTVTLFTSEPITPSHNLLLPERKYGLMVDKTKIRYINSFNQPELIDDKLLGDLNWFQLYIYIVEIELEMIRIYNQLEDSMRVSNDLEALR